ncbi:hypothetical protein ACFY1S_26245 [Micromonospora sp. NPDC000663]|uniref:hypothetical protein n=1 Tax=Micromonospora sp. NPDC000663 TaxID=3364218 RepID=UPI0036788F79
MRIVYGFLRAAGRGRSCYGRWGPRALTNVQQYCVGTRFRLRTVEPTLDGNLCLTTSTGGDKDSIPNNSNEKILKATLGGESEAPGSVGARTRR